MARRRTFRCMSNIGELLGLLYGARDRLPALSAEYWHWYDVQRQFEVRQRAWPEFRPPKLFLPHGMPDLTPEEARTRIVIAPGGRYREDPVSTERDGGPDFTVCDG